MTFSRADGFRCAGPYSTSSSSESSLLCRVCLRGKVVALRSRLEAAASRSGQSDLFTNSNWGRAKSPDLFEEAVRLRAAVDDSGGKNSQDSTSTSSSALVVDSLKSCKVAATFLPIPGVTECCWDASGFFVGDLEDEDDERRRVERGAVFCAPEDGVVEVGFADVDGGRVNARDGLRRVGDSFLTVM